MTTATYKKMLVYIDSTTPANLWAYVLQYERWNGWAIPYFTKEQADKLALFLATQADMPHIDYEAHRDEYVCMDPDSDDHQVFIPEDIETDDGIVHAYPIGAWGWTWMDDPLDPMPTVGAAGPEKLQRLGNKELYRETPPRCEDCGKVWMPTPEDRSEGQVCTECLKHGDLIRITCSVDDNDPRYVAGLSNAKEWIEDGMVYGAWTEFNADEWRIVGPDWEYMPYLDSTSVEALQVSINARTTFLRRFWKRHYDILEARDLEMKKWIKEGTPRVRPIIWTRVPDFRIIVERVG